MQPLAYQSEMVITFTKAVHKFILNYIFSCVFKCILFNTLLTLIKTGNGLVPRQWQSNTFPTWPVTNGSQLLHNQIHSRAY